MAHQKSEEDRIANDRNTARFCVENRQITWVLMIGVILWGAFGYYQMPKRKDPKFGATRAAVICPWPGVSADKIEQLVTKKIEAKIAGNVKILNIQSVSRSNLSVVQIALEESTVSDVNKQYDDIALRLNTINDLPEGAGPVTFLRDFGETAALMLTVSSPKAGAPEIAWRSDRIREVLQAERAKAPAGRRSAGIISFPLSVSPTIPRQDRDLFIQYAKDNNRGHDMVPIEGAGFVGVDGDFGSDDAATTEFANKFLRERLRPSEIHPDIWPIAYVSDLSQTDKRFDSVGGRQIQPQGTRRLFGADSENAPGRTGVSKGEPRRCSRRAHLPGIFAGPACFTWHPAGGAAPGPLAKECESSLAAISKSAAGTC
jgi:hypothetical protein